jgi:hypothetical protein
MALNLDKTDLRDGALMITNADGKIDIIPEEGATETEKLLFEEFRTAYPNGKPVSQVEQQVPQPTEMELLKHQISHLEDYILQKELSDLTN